MEFGDIIYFLLLIAFMILGFFNDARKRKKKEEELKKGGSIPLPDDYPEEYHGSSGGHYGYPEGHYPPPQPPLAPSTGEFQSSLRPSEYMEYDPGSTTGYDYGSFNNVRSSLSEASFSHLAGSSYIPDSPSLPDSPEMPVESRSRRTSDGKDRGGIHPLVAELHGEDAPNELRKGVIYSELLNRRY
ncbi:MAG: hypothetical protein QM237_07075 [Bacteroidota bacterium]|nr:hypothetical protein [Bacteroidota bacterium]HHU97125.1 hypothetical protein [Petrimonas sp.]